MAIRRAKWTASVVPIEDWHLRYVAERLRQEDEAELFATSGLDSYEALKFAADNSIEGFTWLENGEPGCLYGVAAKSEMSLAGVPWLMTTHLVCQHPMKFLRHSMLVVDRFLENFPELENYVDARYAKAVGWLRWLGFAIDEPVVWGPEKVLFHHFWKKSWVG